MLAAMPKILTGTRIGVVREFMIKPLPNDVAISDKIDAQIKTVLRDQLGAELVESVDPLYPDDPTIINMTFTFQDAIAEVLPITESDILGPSEGLRGAMNYYSQAQDAAGTIRKLALLQPETLATMHGSSYRGDGATLLHALADMLAKK